MFERDNAFPGSTVSGTYDFARKAISFGLDDRWKRTALRASNLSDETLRHVDIGTGSGSMLAASPTRFDVPIGVDHEVAMLARARRRVAGVRWVAGDIRAIPFRRQTFDIVTAAYVLRYAEDPLDVIRPVRELLRPGGTLVLYELSRPPSRLLRLVFLSYLVASTTLLGLVLHGNPRRYWHLWLSLRDFDLTRVFDALRMEGFAATSVGTAGGGAIVWVIAELQ